VLISLLGLEPVGGKPLMSVTHGQYDIRPMVTFPAPRHHPLSLNVGKWAQHRSSGTVVTVQRVQRRLQIFRLTYLLTYPLAVTKLYCLVTEARVYEQLVQGCTRQRGGQDLNPQPCVSKIVHNVRDGLGTKFF